MRDLPASAESETPEILLARQLKAQCLLAESDFEAALVEAEKILSVKKDHSVALFVKAEALYANCKVNISISEDQIRRGLGTRERAN